MAAKDYFRYGKGSYLTLKSKTVVHQFLLSIKKDSKQSEKQSI